MLSLYKGSADKDSHYAAPFLEPPLYSTPKEARPFSSSTFKTISIKTKHGWPAETTASILETIPTGSSMQRASPPMKPTEALYSQKAVPPMNGFLFSMGNPLIPSLSKSPAWVLKALPTQTRSRLPQRTGIPLKR